MQSHGLMTGRLVMVRHGESAWNKAGRFTGWTDVDLTDVGRQQIRECGRRLAARGVRINIAFVSTLKRTQESAQIMLDALGTPDVTTLIDGSLDERHYGTLAGMTKQDASETFGAARVSRWQRGYADRPPGGESLCDVRRRAAACLEDGIKPRLAKGGQVLVMGHGNTLRALTMTIERLTSPEIERLEIGTGTGVIYDYDELGRAIGRSPI